VSAAGPFRRILVPHDFSRHADRALALAVALARGGRAALTVLHVVSPVGLARGFPPAATLRAPGTAEIARLRARLERRAARAAGRRRVAIACEVVVGDPERDILAAARHADLVVMGTQGLTGAERLLIGSVAEAVVRRATVPVLTVRPRHRRG
jgi:nucleotide-binding universal stress UspA family protein